MKPASLFDKNHPIVLPKAVSKELCQLLYEYAELKARLKPAKKKKGDPLTGIHRGYNDHLMETLLQRLTPEIEKATGLSLWPTLSFYYTYQHGNQLQPHVDRSSCEIVAGLCIGADAAFKEENKSWPLILEVNGTAKIMDLEEGDLLIFKGHETKHWRETFTGKTFVSAIFAYVDKNGPFAFQKYDQRAALGKPHVGMFLWYYGCIKNKIMRKFKPFLA
jgi:hypothetical protein